MTTTIGLVECPRQRLLDRDGNDWQSYITNGAKGSKLILAGTLDEAGYDIALFDLEAGADAVSIGEVEWEGVHLTKVVTGTHWRTLDPLACDLWGVTSNFHHHQEIVCAVIRHLASGAPVVVGGSDALTNPGVYIAAGASVVVMEKSGGANIGAVELALYGHSDRPYTVYTVNGHQQQGRRMENRLHPERWPLPPPHIVPATFGGATGKTGWRQMPVRLDPLAQVMLDQGCDRSCDFCLTPTYGLGFQAMSTDRVREWMSLVKAAGARGFDCSSDQFLGRVMWSNGREAVLDIVQSARDLDLRLMWGNGIEMSKATVGRGFPRGDPTPDEELVEALFGWDGEHGCAFSLIPGERPVEGNERYSKLLAWQHHRTFMRSVVRAGVPYLLYNVIIGFPEDSHESLTRLYEALNDLWDEVMAINPNLTITLNANAIVPLPGTPLTAQQRRAGLMPQEIDPALVNKWTPPCATHYLTRREVAAWQHWFADAFVTDRGAMGVTGPEMSGSQRRAVVE